MKRLIIKEGYFQEITAKSKKKIENGLDFNSWLRVELLRLGVPFSDACCNDPIIPPTGVDTRLDNPHIIGNNLVFDILNVTTNVVTPNAVSVTLPGATTEIVNVFPNLNSGSTVTITNTPAVNTIPLVFRNGRFQVEGTDYTRSGVTISFTIPFGISGGAVGPEEVAVHYKY